MNNADENQNGSSKEAHVIWGRPEIPKLFASSHYSQKLLKNHPFVLKKAICLARYEQDPMNEILNLWSPIMVENQALNINFHPLQKHINRARLMDVLEEVNIQMLNSVGVDINMVIDHEHMHNQLQFLSGLGPRKAQKLIQKLKSRGKAINSRMEVYEQKILDKKCFMSSIGFIKVRVPLEKRHADSNEMHNIEYLDQTRIHLRQYDKMKEIAGYCVFQNQNKEDLDDMKKHQAILELLTNPDKLNQMVSLGQMNDQVKGIGQRDIEDLTKTTEQIIRDFMMPFKDPREDKDVVRDITDIKFPKNELFYFLLDESERTFKNGMIVSATVVRIYDK